MYSNNANMMIVSRLSEGDVSVYENLQSKHSFQREKRGCKKGSSKFRSVHRVQTERGRCTVQDIQSTYSFHGKKRGCMHRIVPNARTQRLLSIQKRLIRNGKGDLTGKLKKSSERCRRSVRNSLGTSVAPRSRGRSCRKDLGGHREPDCTHDCHWS